MAGLLNAESKAAPMPAPADGKKPQLDDPLLQQVEQGIDSKVPASERKMYMSIIVSAMSIMYDKQSSKFIEQRMQASEDMAKNVADGVADLIILVFQNSGISPKDTPRAQKFFDAAMLACIPLMCQVLDMGEKIGALEVSNELVDETTALTYKETMRRFGVTEEMVRAEMAKAQGGAQVAPAQAAPPAPMQGV